MANKILDNSKGREVVSYVQGELPHSKEAKFAIGYFYLSGFQLVESHFPVGSDLKPFLKIVMGRETDSETSSELITGYEAREKIKQELLEELQSTELSDEKKDNIRSLANLIEKGIIEIKLFESARLHAKLYLFLNHNPSPNASKGQALVGSSNFTSAGLTQNKELNIKISDAEEIDYLNEWYDKLWDEASEFKKDLLKIVEVSGIKKPSAATPEYPHIGTLVSPEELFKYLVYKWFDGKVMNMLKKDILAEFQMVGVLNTIKIIDYYNGAIVADSVGLGKSFIAMAIIEEFIQKKHTDWIKKDNGGVPGVLLIVPPSVINQWEELIIGSLDNKDESEYKYLQAGQLIKIQKSDFFKNKHVSIAGAYKENDISFQIFTENGNELLGIIRLYSVGLFQSDPAYNKLLDTFKETYDLIVVDEAHKFKNRGSNRWKSLKALHKKKNHKLNKMLLLTATPMSNSIYELYNLIQLFNDETFQPFTLKGIMVSKLFETYQKAFQESKTNDSDEKRKELLDAASELKQKVIDEVVLLRTRKYIKENFQDVKINDKPLVFQDPVVSSLDYSGYSSKQFQDFISLVCKVLPELEFEHTKLYGAISVFFGDTTASENTGSGMGIKIADLFRLLLGKRIESSVYAFETTLRKIAFKERTALFYFTHNISIVKSKQDLQKFIEKLLEETKIKADFELNEEENYLEEDPKWFQSVWNLWTQYTKIELEKQKSDMPLTDAIILDFGSRSVVSNLKNDLKNIEAILEKLDDLKEKDADGNNLILGDLPHTGKDALQEKMPIWIYKYDPKIIALRQILGSPSGQSEILKVPNLSDKKTIIFTQYKDTAYYLYRNLEDWVNKNSFAKEIYQDIKHNNRSRIGLVTGETDSSSRNNLKKRFAPRANKGEDEIKRAGELNVLVATDAFSEGVNLQDGHALVNFDLPWNPMLIVQRVGRVNRIGSENIVDVINFKPTDEIQLIVTVLAKLKEKIKDITNILGKESKILDADEEISVETFGQKIQKMSEVSIDDLEEMGMSDELKKGFSLKDKLQADEFKLLNEIQTNLRYTPRDFAKYEKEIYSNKIYYSFVPGADKVYSIYEFKRGKEGERKVLEKKILSSSLENPTLVTEESPLALLHLVKEDNKAKPVKILEIADLLKSFKAKVDERKEEIEDATVIVQRGFLNKLTDFLGRHAPFKQNDLNWKEKLPVVFNKLNILRPQEHVPKIRTLLETAGVLNEKSGKVGLTDPDKSLDILYEYLKFITDINFEQEINHYGWFYERKN